MTSKTTMKSFSRLCLAVLFICSLSSVSSAQEKQTADPCEATKDINIQTIDISGRKDWQCVVAQGYEGARQNSPCSLLMPDGKTIFLTWALNETGNCGQLKKSTDGGLSWSGLLDVPSNWSKYRNCPPLYLLKDPQGKERVFIFANRTPYGLFMASSYSEDQGLNWTPFEPVRVQDRKDTLKADVMPFTSIIAVDGGKRLLGFTNLRSPYLPEMHTKGNRSNIVCQSSSVDGGLTWTRWRVILDLGEGNTPCEPEVIVSPDGKDLLMLIRDNNRDNNSWMMISHNMGRTWEGLRQLPASLTMDRHTARYLPDGRLLIAGRDVAQNSPCKKHYVAWVGTYEDIVTGREGQYRIKMLHSYGSTMYPALSVLDDGTVVAINSIVNKPDENYSLVQTRFNIKDIDAMFKARSGFMPAVE